MISPINPMGPVILTQIPTDIDTTNKLYENEEFCTKLGKVILKSSLLGEQLLILIQNEKLDNDDNKPPMAMLIKYIDKKEFFPAIVPVLNQMTENNIDSLLSKAIGRSFIEDQNLDDDLNSYINSAIDLENKINLIYNMIKEHNKISL